ncbi:MAG: SEC10/PgrA surface exclusion domain-containing protein [Lactobacillus sp.]|nr:SEC10/PgrA surface exclusion domain-containing protein [Lactobacillus sp.]
MNKNIQKTTLTTSAVLAGMVLGVNINQNGVHADSVADQTPAQATTVDTNTQTQLQDAQANVASAQTANSNAQSALTSANTDVNNAQTAVNQAQDNLNSAQDVYTQAQSDLTSAQVNQNAGSQAIADAQSAIGTAQNVVDHTNQAVSQYQDTFTKADSAQSTAQDAQSQAQADYNQAKTANDQAQQAVTDFENTKPASATPTTETITNVPDIKIPSDYSSEYDIDAINADAMHAHIKTKAGREAMANAFNAYIYSERDHPTNPNDVNETIDVYHLTPEQTQEITTYAANIINNARQQIMAQSNGDKVAQGYLSVSANASKLGAEIIDQAYNKNNWSKVHGMQHHIDDYQVNGPDQDNLEASVYQHGLKTKNLDTYNGKIYGYNDNGMAFSECIGFATWADGTPVKNMHELKEFVFESIVEELFADTSYGVQADSMVGFGGHTQALLNSNSIYAITNTPDKAKQFFTLTIDNAGRMHFLMFTDQDANDDVAKSIDTDAVTPLGITSKTVTTNGDDSAAKQWNAKLDQLKQTAQDAQSKLTQAQNTLNDKNTALKSAQSKLTQAQNDLATAKKAQANAVDKLNEAKTKLNDLQNSKATLKKAQDNATVAAIKLSDAKTAMQKANDTLKQAKDSQANAQKTADQAKTALDQALSHLAGLEAIVETQDKDQAKDNGYHVNNGQVVDQNNELVNNWHVDNDGNMVSPNNTVIANLSQPSTGTDDDNKPSTGNTDNQPTTGSNDSSKPSTGDTNDQPSTGSDDNSKPSTGNTDDQPSTGSDDTNKPATGDTNDQPSTGSDNDNKPSTGDTNDQPSTGSDDTNKPATGNTDNQPATSSNDNSKPSTGTTDNQPTTDTVAATDQPSVTPVVPETSTAVANTVAQSQPVSNKVVETPSEASVNMTRAEYKQALNQSSSKTSDSQAQASSLPQTGDDKSSLAMVLLGTVAAMFGVGLATKKKEY